MSPSRPERGCPRAEAAPGAADTDPAERLAVRVTGSEGVGLVPIHAAALARSVLARTICSRRLELLWDAIAEYVWSCA
jgi:hypothetical protein